MSLRPRLWGMLEGLAESELTMIRHLHRNELSGEAERKGLDIPNRNNPTSSTWEQEGWIYAGQQQALAISSGATVAVRFASAHLHRLE